MKKLIKDFENYLQKVKISQKIIIYLMPIMIIAAFVFMYIKPMQDEKLEIVISQQEQLQRDIKRKQPQVIKNKIKKSQKELLSLKNEVGENRDSLIYLYAKLTNLEISNFDEKRWANTLDSILKKSLDLDITIDYIKNQEPKGDINKSEIIPKKYVEIRGRGSYNNTLEYLNFIENREFIVDINDINIQKPQKDEDRNDIQFSIKFTIYGVNI